MNDPRFDQEYLIDMLVAGTSGSDPQRFEAFRVCLDERFPDLAWTTADACLTFFAVSMTAKPATMAWLDELTTRFGFDGAAFVRDALGARYARVVADAAELVAKFNALEPSLESRHGDDFPYDATIAAYVRNVETVPDLATAFGVVREECVARAPECDWTMPRVVAALLFVAVHVHGTRVFFGDNHQQVMDHKGLTREVMLAAFAARVGPAAERVARSESLRAFVVGMLGRAAPAGHGTTTPAPAGAVATQVGMLPAGRRAGDPKKRN